MGGSENDSSNRRAPGPTASDNWGRVTADFVRQPAEILPGIRYAGGPNREGREKAWLTSGRSFGTSLEYDRCIHRTNPLAGLRTAKPLVHVIVSPTPYTA